MWYGVGSGGLEAKFSDVGKPYCSPAYSAWVTVVYFGDDLRSTELPNSTKGGVHSPFQFPSASQSRAGPSFKNKAENGAPMNRSTDPPHNILEDLVCSL